MIIFWRLLLAHLLADFTLQTTGLSQWKRKSHAGLLLHAAIYFAATALLTYPYLNNCWLCSKTFNIKGWTAVLALAAAHYLGDYARAAFIKNKKDKDTTALFILDQLLHILFIFIFSPIDFAKNGYIFPELWVALGCFFIAVSHGTAAFSYFLDKDFHNAEPPAFDEKYFAMFERIALWLIFLIPGFNWAPYFLVWLGLAFYAHFKRIIDFSKIGFYAGIIITVALGIISRYACY
ncbi:MAG: DUF3307 domain-containing protein [Elusimicrobia bacterium]|nr:DUF3307 domain-containing protein [Elusimicrobiota bacterium]